MKTLKTMILSVGAVALLGASGLYAQKATADIPFEFAVGNTTMPAGHYTMATASTSRDLMLIRGETGKAALVLAPSSESGYKQSQEKNVVVFHQVGGRYFLADVKTAAICGHVSPSSLERELTSGNGQPVAAVIVPALSVR